MTPPASWALDASPAELRDAFDLVLIGGNHLANILIGALGPSFPREFPPETESDVVLHKLGAGNMYDVWCCWANIMRARAILRGVP